MKRILPLLLVALALTGCVGNALLEGGDYNPRGVDSLTLNADMAAASDLQLALTVFVFSALGAMAALVVFSRMRRK